jgi:integrase
MYTAETPDGPRRKYIYGRKYKDVERELAEAMGDAAKGIYFDDENQTVAQYMERWLEDSARGDLGHRAYHNYKLQIRRHISPAFGSLKLSKLTADRIQSLYAAKLRGGLKPSSVRYIHAVLHRALEQAVRFNLIPFNPASRVDPPKIKQEEESMRPVKCVRVPCRSNPHRSLARHQLGLFGQLLLPSIQLRQGPGAEIAF